MIKKYKKRLEAKMQKGKDEMAWVISKVVDLWSSNNYDMRDT